MSMKKPTIDPLALTIRPWRREDLAAGLELFDSNVPRFFDPSERSDFIEYVEATEEPYFVLADATGRIVACGGFERINGDPATMGLCWGMVHSDLHKMGLGDLLLRTRLDMIAAYPAHRTVAIETTQHSKGFFARYGFAETRCVADGFAPGMDLVGMVLDLDLYRSSSAAKLSV